MKTIIKTGIWRILKQFYENKNSALHLREISRKSGLNESGVFRYLNSLVNDKILLEKKEMNMRFFKLSKKGLVNIFPIFDFEKIDSLQLLRKNAIKFYLDNLIKKPVIVVLFGSSAKGSYKKESDIDILEIVNSKQDNKKARGIAEAQTGIKIQVFQITLKELKKELKMQEDKVVASAIETGLPVFNNKYFYEVVYE